MIVQNVLDYITDNTNVCIMDAEGNILAEYDGRDSIPKTFGKYLVNSIYTSTDYRGRTCICIEV